MNNLTANPAKMLCARLLGTQVLAEPWFLLFFNVIYCCFAAVLLLPLIATIAQIKANLAEIIGSQLGYILHLPEQVLLRSLILYTAFTVSF